MKETYRKDSGLEGVIAKVKSNVIGQNIAVEKICSLIDVGKKRWSALQRFDLGTESEPSFCSGLVIGTSGSGKTYMLKNIAQAEDMIFWEIDATTLTGEGWSGASLSTHWKMLAEKMEEDPDKLVLIYIDEVDKLLKEDGYPGSAKFDLLKPLEGGILRAEYDHKQFEINFDRCVVVMSGAFTDIDEFRAEKEITIGFKGAPKAKEDKRKGISREDLINWGTPRELVGRFSLILNLNELQYSDYKKIIDTQITKKYSALLFPNFELKVSDEAANFLAKAAIENNLGARFINQCINEVFTEKIWRNINLYSSVGGIVKLVLDGNSLGYKLEGSSSSVSKTFIKKKDDEAKRNYCARMIRDLVDMIELQEDEPRKREILVDNLFEYMAILKYDIKNSHIEDDEQKVHNDYSFAELDLLFSILFLLKYCICKSDFNYDGLKSVFSLCRVNCQGADPFDSYFHEAVHRRIATETDTSSMKSVVTGIVVESKKSVASKSCDAPQTSIRRTVVNEYELAIRAHHEFMSHSSSVRDEAVKMLAWRLS